MGYSGTKHSATLPAGTVGYAGGTPTTGCEPPNVQPSETLYGTLYGTLGTGYGALNSNPRPQTPKPKSHEQVMGRSPPGKDRPAQSLEPPWGRASHLQRCSGSAATQQDLCKTVIATSKVNWATTLACVLKPKSREQVMGRSPGICSGRRAPNVPTVPPPPFSLLS